MVGECDWTKDLADEEERVTCLIRFPRRHFEELWAAEEVIETFGLATVETLRSDRAVPDAKLLGKPQEGRERMLSHLKERDIINRLAMACNRLSLWSVESQESSDI